VSHENEVVLPNGYVVDLLIHPGYAHQMPWQRAGTKSVTTTAAGNRNSKSFKGIVLEIDGPFHFDTYMQQPLGGTIMKRRHLRSMGFELVSLPFWQYKVGLPKDQKVRILRNVLK
jgi:hypothetical protein